MSDSSTFTAFVDPWLLEYNDCTDFLHSKCTEMSLGQMVSSDRFNLFDASVDWLVVRGCAFMIMCPFVD